MWKRYFDFILKEKTKNFIAFMYYFSIIVWMFEINLPIGLNVTWKIIIIFTQVFVVTIYMVEAIDKMFYKPREKKTELGKQRIKKILKEIMLCIPVIFISICINAFIIIGKPANQISIEQSFDQELVWNIIFCIIIGPIVEEIMFRFLPSRFIKNKILYITVSTVVFAAAHVVNDPNSFYYIWFYMLRSFYYGYRYYKTKDIWVPISIHSFNNLIAATLILL